MVLVMIWGEAKGLLRTAHEVDPRAHAHLLRRLHHLERFVQEHLAGQGVVDDFDVAVREREPPPIRILCHAHATSEGQLEHYAASQRIRDVVVPK